MLGWDGGVSCRAPCCSMLDNYYGGRCTYDDGVTMFSAFGPKPVQLPRLANKRSVLETVEEPPMATGYATGCVITLGSLLEQNEPRAVVARELPHDRCHEFGLDRNWEYTYKPPKLDFTRFFSINPLLWFNLAVTKLGVHQVQVHQWVSTTTLSRW